jgi:hypothetical protein
MVVALQLGMGTIGRHGWGTTGVVAAIETLEAGWTSPKVGPGIFVMEIICLDQKTHTSGAPTYITHAGAK